MQLISFTTCAAFVTLFALHGLAAETSPWPPKLPGVEGNKATLTSQDFLNVPEEVASASKQPGAAPFAMAKAPPRVTLLFHDNLGPDAAVRRLWSSWGDI